MDDAPSELSALAQSNHEPVSASTFVAVLDATRPRDHREGGATVTAAPNAAKQRGKESTAAAERSAPPPLGNQLPPSPVEVAVDAEEHPPLVKQQSSFIANLTHHRFHRNNKGGEASPSTVVENEGELSTFAMMRRQQIPYASTDNMQRLVTRDHGNAGDGFLRPQTTATWAGAASRKDIPSNDWSAPEGLNLLGKQQRQVPHQRGKGTDYETQSGPNAARSQYGGDSQLRRRHHSRSRLQQRSDAVDGASEGRYRDADAYEGTFEEAAVARDSFGNTAYQRVFPGDPFDFSQAHQNGGSRPVASDVPWDLRDTAYEDHACSYFAFLSSRYFWFLVEWAARVTFIGMLVPAALINANLPNTPFISNTFALTSVVIAAGVSFGQSSFFFVQYVKAGCLWLPLATACSALRLNRYLGAWFVVYTVVLFLLGTFTEKTTRRMCLLLYNIAMVSLLSGNEDLVFPSRMLVDWFLGAAFALVATLIPYPMLATRASAKISANLFTTTATCFTGILVCFWAPSNTQRSMSMVRIRHLVRTIDQLIDRFDAYDTYTFYEMIFFERYERREVRRKKVELMLKLKMNLRAMERVINVVQEKPQMLDQSARCLLLRMHLSQPMEAISQSMEALLASLSKATMYADLRQLSPCFEAAGRAIKALQDEFDVARRILFYEDDECDALSRARFRETVMVTPTATTGRRQSAGEGQEQSHQTSSSGGGKRAQPQGRRVERAAAAVEEESNKAPKRASWDDTPFAAEDKERMEEFVPLMTFFVFSVVNFWSTLNEFQIFIHRHKPIRDWHQSFRLVSRAVLDPFVENAMLVKHLVTRRGEAEVRVVVEAAKVSVAMLIAVIFFYYIDDQTLLLSGPTVIAFVSGTNPVEAVQASAARLSGTLFGACLGFFAASLCNTAVDRVAALCVITFAMTFFRTDKKVGVVCMYCNFVAVSSLGPPGTTAESTISRIQQNTFAIFIYCFISVSVFPVSPNRVLFEKRLSVVRSVSETVKKLMGLLAEASACYVETEQQVRRGHHLHDAGGGGVNSEDNKKNNSSLMAGAFVGSGGLGSTMNLQRSRVFMPATLTADGSAVPVPLHNANINAPPLFRDADKDFSHRHGDDIVSIPLTGQLGKQAGANNGSSTITMMPKAFVMAPEDTTVENIFVDIFKTLETMKTTTSVMPLAADEFSVIPKEYPLRATGDVHAALYRLCALIYTMACSWKVMREKGYFTKDVVHIFHNLAPLAMDITLCLERFSNTLTFYVHHPSSGLSSELTKVVMQLRALCVEFSARKERDLLAVIRKTRAEKGIHANRGRHRHRHRRHARGSRASKSSSSSSSDGGVDDKSDAVAGQEGEPVSFPGHVEAVREVFSAATRKNKNRPRKDGEGDHERTIGSLSNHSRSGPAMNATCVFVPERRDTLGRAEEASSSDNTDHHDNERRSTEEVGNERSAEQARLVTPSVAETAASVSSSVERRHRKHQHDHNDQQGLSDARNQQSQSHHGQGTHTYNSSNAELASISLADRRAQQLRDEVHRSHQRQKMRRAYSCGSGMNVLVHSHESPSLISGFPSREDLFREERVLRHAHSADAVTFESSPRAPKIAASSHAAPHRAGKKKKSQGKHSNVENEEEERRLDENVRHAEDTTMDLPYGSRRSPHEDAVSPETHLQPGEEARGGDVHVDDVAIRVRAQQRKNHEPTSTPYGGNADDDRITLHNSSSSDSDDDRTSSSSLSYSYSSGGGSAQSGLPSSSSSIVRFNDSFTTPVTVLDAEGLHSFTLSLEMLTRELRKVLFGLEEMLQSQ